MIKLPLSINSGRLSLGKKKKIWNIECSTGSRDNILDTLMSMVAAGYRGITVACANPHSQVSANAAQEFHDALNSFDVILPDGVGTILAARVLGISDIHRFTGPDFFSLVSDRLNAKENQHNYYFIGSTESVLSTIREKMSERFPHIKVVGTYSPPFHSAIELFTEHVVEKINAADPTFVWVGMTAPKQELWMKYCVKRLNASVVAGIGAEFDYFAEIKKRPPLWVRKSGLQWLYRLIQEPRRTWRRHFISMPVFIVHILLEWFKQRS